MSRARFQENFEPISDEGYVQACIDLANDPSNCRDGEVLSHEPAPDAGLVNCYLIVMSNEAYDWQSIIHEDFAQFSRTAAQQLRKQLRKELRLAVSNLASARRRRRSKIDVMLDGIAVKTDLHLQRDGRVEHRHRYCPKDHEAAIALLWAFLLDPDRPFENDLRVCGLEGCERFYLATKNPDGGPRPKYCSPEHAKTADHRMAAKRVARFRQRERRTK